MEPHCTRTQVSNGFRTQTRPGRTPLWKPEQRSDQLTLSLCKPSFLPPSSPRPPEYVSPNTVRHLARHKKGQEYKSRANDQDAFKTKVAKLQRERKVNELATDRVFA